jgi:hypothetical protein
MRCSRWCPTVKVIVPAGKPDGWDAFDALAEGWSWQRVQGMGLAASRNAGD